MRLVLCCLLVTAGCYGPSYRDCEVSCAGGTCPSGLSCVDQVCRTEGASGACGVVNDDAGVDSGIDADPNLDGDGDGILNGADNCPAKANADQNDEDNDTLGDVCDPCPVPFLQPPSGGADFNHDTDGDGVGDGCDPRPAMPGDRIAVFDPLLVRPVAATVNGPWQFSGGVATVTAPQNPPAAMLWPQPTQVDMTPSSVLVVTTTTVSNLNPGGFVGPFADMLNGSGVGCGLGRDQTGLSGLMALHIDASGSVQRLNQMPHNVDVGTAEILLLQRTGGQMKCFDSMVNFVTQVPNSTMGALTGVLVAGMAAKLDFVEIIASPP